MNQAKPEPRCWDCGAANDTGARECWLCHRRDWLSGGIVFPSKGGASRRLTEDQFSKGDVAVLLGWFAFLIAIVIVPILAIISLWVALGRICFPWTQPH